MDRAKTYRPGGGISRVHLRAEQATVAKIHGSHRWRKISLLKRQMSPLCEPCAAKGKTVEAASVHHLVPIAVDPDRAFDMQNLQSVCAACHNALDGKRRG